MMSSTRNELDKSVVKKMELVLNRYLKRYDWFEKIELETVGYSPSERVSHFAPVGTIYVDGDWLYERWREYHYEGPFPDLYDEDWGLSFGDFIGGDLSEKLRGEFTTIFAGITDYVRPKYISWSWLKVRTKDDDTQNLRESIRRVLKENTLRVKMEKLIDKVGFENACKSVGGIQQIAKIMDVRPIELLEKYFIGHKLSTQEIDKDVPVGGYDFEFKPTAISENYMEGIYIDYTITKGTIHLIYGTGETFDLFDPSLRKKEYWWEIEYELQDIFRDYSMIYLRRLNYNMDDDTAIFIEVNFDDKA